MVLHWTETLSLYLYIFITILYFSYFDGIITGFQMRQSNMRPFSQMPPFFSHICGRFQLQLRMFLICDSHFAYAFSAKYIRNAAVNFFFVNPHICEKYADLICIYNRVFSSKRTYATGQAFWYSLKSLVVMLLFIASLLTPSLSSECYQTKLTTRVYNN